MYSVKRLYNLNIEIFFVLSIIAKQWRYFVCYKVHKYQGLIKRKPVK